jgi:hypothetical protein
MIHNATPAFGENDRQQEELSPMATLIFVVNFLNIFVSVGDQE